MQAKGDFRLRKKISKSRYGVITLATFVIIFSVWYAISISGYVKEMFLPSPGKVIADIINGASNGNLWNNAEISIYRITMGFILAVVLGVPLGILAGCFKPFEAITNPLCEFIRYMPVPAFVPLVMVWFGIGETAKIVVVFLGSFFQLVLMIADDARTVPEDLLSASYTLGTTRWETIIKVVIPAMAPRMMLTLRMMIGWAWTYLTVAELVASNSGLGYQILQAQRFYQTQGIFSGILIIGLLGLITDRIFAFAIKKMFPWNE